MAKNTTIELLKMSEETAEKIKTIKKDIEQIETINGDIIHDALNNIKNYDIDSMRATLNENHAKIEKLNNKMLALSIKNQVVKNNIKYNTIDILIECLQNVLPKYCGKSAGAKTLDKMKNEIAQYTGARSAYFENYSFGTYIYISMPTIDNRYTSEYIYLYLCPSIFDDNNKIRDISGYNLKNQYNYVDDIGAKTAEIIDAKKRLEIAKEKYNEISKECNAIFTSISDLHFNE